MKRAAIVIGLVVLTGCATAPLPMPVRGYPANEICIAYAEALIAGGSGMLGARMVPAATLHAELFRRGEPCAPSETYLQVAAQRLNARSVARAQQSAQVFQAGVLMLQQSQPQSIYQPVLRAPAQTRTRCAESYGEIICDSVGR